MYWLLAFSATKCDCWMHVASAPILPGRDEERSDSFEETPALPVWNQAGVWWHNCTHQGINKHRVPWNTRTSMSGVMFRHALQVCKHFRKQRSWRPEVSVKAAVGTIWATGETHKEGPSWRSLEGNLLGTNPSDVLSSHSQMKKTLVPRESHLIEKNHIVSSYEWQGCMKSHHSIIIYSLPLKILTVFEVRQFWKMFFFKIRTLISKTWFLFPCVFRTKLWLQKSRSKRSFSSCASFCKRKKPLDWPPCSRRMRRRKSWWGRSQRASPVVSSPSLTPSLPLRMRLLLTMLSSSRWELSYVFLSVFLWPGSF